MADERSEKLIHGDENYVAEQERAAAEDAAAIGGDPGGDYEVEESERALAEAGGGEAEGFELAEEELIENATHEADANPDPTHLTGIPEDDRADSEYGESDTEPIEDA
jgi:hypothetical protein